MSPFLDERFFTVSLALYDSPLPSFFVFQVFVAYLPSGGVKLFSGNVYSAPYFKVISESSSPEPPFLSNLIVYLFRLYFISTIVEPSSRIVFCETG